MALVFPRSSGHHQTLMTPEVTSDEPVADFDPHSVRNEANVNEWMGRSVETLLLGHESKCPVLLVPDDENHNDHDDDDAIDNDAMEDYNNNSDYFDNEFFHNANRNSVGMMDGNSSNHDNGDTHRSSTHSHGNRIGMDESSSSSSMGYRAHNAYMRDTSIGSLEAFMASSNSSFRRSSSLDDSSRVVHGGTLALYSNGRGRPNRRRRSSRTILAERNGVDNGRVGHEPIERFHDDNNHRTSHGNSRGQINKGGPNVTLSLLAREVSI